MSRLAPLKGRVGEELPGAKAPSRVARQSVPGRELLDLRERDDGGDVVPVKPARVGRKRLKPPTPVAASSGGRGAQRLSASPALGKAPLSRRLPPLTQRIEERKGRESGLAGTGGLSKGEQNAGAKSAAQSVGSPSRSAEGTAIELIPKSPQSSKAPSAAPPKPQLLTSPPASEVRVPGSVILGLGFGLLLIGGVFAVRFISTSPAGGGLRKDAALRLKSNRPGSGTGVVGEERGEKRGAISEAESEDGSLEEGFSDDQDSSSEADLARESGAEEGAPLPRKARRDEGGALQEVKEQSAIRVRDTMLRAMLIDVIDAIEQAVRSAEGVIDQLEQGEVEMSERLQQMANISQEAVAALTQGNKNSKENKGIEPTKGAVETKGVVEMEEVKKPVKAPAKGSPSVTLAEKKRRLIEGLPDVDPFAKD